MKVLYIDSLLIFELASDVTLLWAAGKLCRAGRRPLRLLAAGGLGAAYTLLTVLWAPAGTLVCRAAVLAAMLLTAYGGERGLWRIGLAYLGMCAVYAGAAAAVTYTAGRASLRALLFALGMSLGLCSLPFRFPRPAGGTVQLTLVCGDRQVELRALRDTGNRLREPISGEGTVIADEAALLPLLKPEQRLSLARSAGKPAAERLLSLGPGFRLLPYRTLDGGGLLLAFRPERVYMDGVCRCDLWAALAPGPLAPGSGCSAIIGGEQPE